MFDGQFEIRNGFVPECWGIHIEKINCAPVSAGISKVHVYASLRQWMGHVQAKAMLRPYPQRICTDLVFALNGTDRLVDQDYLVRTRFVSPGKGRLASTAFRHFEIPDHETYLLAGRCWFQSDETR